MECYAFASFWILFLMAAVLKCNRCDAHPCAGETHENTATVSLEFEDEPPRCHARDKLLEKELSGDPMLGMVQKRAQLIVNKGVETMQDSGVETMREKQAADRVLPDSKAWSLTGAAFNASNAAFNASNAASNDAFNASMPSEATPVLPSMPLSFLEVESKSSLASTRTAGIVYNLHKHFGFKGPSHYPHMHTLQHRSIQRPAAKDKMVEDFRSLFSTSSSSLKESRVILTLLCCVLIASSAVLNIMRKNDKVLRLSYDQTAAHGDCAAAPGLSTWDATVTTFSAIFGMGCLCLPYTISLAGWIGIPLIMFFTGCAAYTGHMLTWVLQQEAQRIGSRVLLSWGFLLEVTYGHKARCAVNIFLVVELWGYVLSGIVAASTTLNQLFVNLNSSAAVGIAVLVQFVFTTVDTKLLARLNVICNILFVVCCLMFIVTGLVLPPKPTHSEPEFVKPQGILPACGVIIFSPAAHSLFPAIMNRMEHPEKYPTCLRSAYLMACIAYVCFAVAGYYLFGSDVQPSAVRNIGVGRNLEPLPNLGWMNQVAALCILVKVSGLQPLIMVPLSSTIEGMLADWLPRRVLSTLVVPIMLTISAVVAIHFANNMATLLNLVGSIFCMNIAFVLPTLCYWRINAGNIGLGRQLLFSGFILMGGCFAFLGLITAADDQL